jgi:hypothetical protein
MGSIKRSASSQGQAGKATRAEAGHKVTKRPGFPADDEDAGPARPGEGDARLVERPDGFYWQDEFSAKLYGPFPTMTEAMQDMQYREDSDYEVGESLQEAESEIGIADWVDPETGELAEGLTPHRGD